MADNWILDGTIAERTMKPLYLDHAATAPPCAAALKAFNDACAAAYANPGSLHQPGADAARLITKSRNKILKLLNASNYKLAFTATGTESNRLGICGHHSSGVALVGATEHPSSLKTVESLNCDYRRVQVLQDGRIDLEDFKSKLNSDVSLVSMQWVNNELGCVQPLTEMVALTRQLAPNAHFHVDAIQAAGKFILHLDQIDADSFAIAAH
ncbi:MAG: aminotransferase class V-fold PLP-dependent enzyme, partial [Planctomycetota bacterium]|nr:aminotransferase class V-fold PLP-dependent enzyme [Planctomycetota bacterium]